MIELVLLSELKERVGIQGNVTARDDVLQALIRSVSARVERYIDRQIEKTTTTEVFDVARNQRVFFLKAYPTTSVTTVHWDSDFAWGSSTLVSSDRYALSNSGADGMIVFDAGYLSPGENVLKVVYVGGIADSTEELLALNSDLSDAALRQILNDYNRRLNAGASSVASGGIGSISYQADGGLLTSVKEDLRHYKRYGS